MTLVDTQVMRSFAARASIYLALATLAGTQTACSLFDSDFDGSVRLVFSISDETNTYEDNQLFDPNDNEDFRDNRDRIKDGVIESMEFQFPVIEAGNAANIIFGDVDVRPAGETSEDAWVQGVSAWEGVQVVSPSTYFVDIPGDRQQILSDLVFGAEPGESQLELRIQGGADEGPVRFDIAVTLNLFFTAGL